MLIMPARTNSVKRKLHIYSLFVLDNNMHNFVLSACKLDASEVRKAP